MQHLKEGNVGKVGGVICILGKLVDMIPMVSEASGIITNTGEVIEALDYKRQQNLIERISKLGTLHELQKLCSFVAVNLTKRYENQLRQLQTLQEQQAALGVGQQQKPNWSIRSALKRTKQEVEKVVLDKDPKSASEAMSDYVLTLLWDELQNDGSAGVSLEKRMIECVTIPPPQKTGVLSALQTLIADASAFKMVTIFRQSLDF